MKTFNNFFGTEKLERLPQKSINQFWMDLISHTSIEFHLDRLEHKFCNININELIINDKGMMTEEIIHFDINATEFVYRNFHAIDNSCANRIICLRKHF